MSYKKVRWRTFSLTISSISGKFKFCNVWRALDTYVTSHETCANAEIWEACWHVSRPELHARSRDVSRVTEVWIRAIEFNVKSPLACHLHALTWHELTWREDSVFPALLVAVSLSLNCSGDIFWFSRMTEQRRLRTLWWRKAEGWREMLFELAVKVRASGRRIVKSRAELINSTGELAECFLSTFFF
jgi:hypothetical protein